MVQLIDATQYADQYKGTFEIPDIEELRQIKKNWVLKVCDGSERFWTQVTEIEFDEDNIYDSKVTAVIDNHLYYEKDYDYGTIIEYKLKNIYAVKNPTQERYNALREMNLTNEQILHLLIYHRRCMV